MTEPAATRFFAVHDLRRHIYQLVPNATLTTLARTNSAILNEVAEIIWTRATFRDVWAVSMDSPRRPVYLAAVKSLSFDAAWATESVRDLMRQLIEVEGDWDIERPTYYLAGRNKGKMKPRATRYPDGYENPDTDVRLTKEAMLDMIKFVRALCPSVCNVKFGDLAGLWVPHETIQTIIRLDIDLDPGSDRAPLTGRIGLRYVISACHDMYSDPLAHLIAPDGFDLILRATLSAVWELEHDPTTPIDEVSAGWTIRGSLGLHHWIMSPRVDCSYWPSHIDTVHIDSWDDSQDILPIILEQLERRADALPISRISIVSSQRLADGGWRDCFEAGGNNVERWDFDLQTHPEVQQDHPYDIDLHDLLLSASQLPKLRELTMNGAHFAPPPKDAQGRWKRPVSCSSTLGRVTLYLIEKDEGSEFCAGVGDGDSAHGENDGAGGEYGSDTRIAGRAVTPTALSIAHYISLFTKDNADIHFHIESSGNYGWGAAEVLEQSRKGRTWRDVLGCLKEALAFKSSAYANLDFDVCSLKTIKDVDNFCALPQRVKEQVLHGGKMPVQVIGNALITDFFKVKPSSTNSWITDDARRAILDGTSVTGHGSHCLIRGLCCDQGSK